MDKSRFFFCLLMAFSIALIGCQGEKTAQQPAASTNVANELLAGDSEGPDEVVLPTDEGYSGDEKNAVSADKLIQLVKVQQVRELSVGMNNPSAVLMLSSAQQDDISAAQREFLAVESVRRSLPRRRLRSC